MSDERQDGRRENYARILPLMREQARQLGYALAVHGSEMRDLDVIAVPWVETAAAEDVFVESLRKTVGGYLVYNRRGELDYTRKLHRRHAYKIYLGDDSYVDLSVMPIEEHAGSCAKYDQRITALEVERDDARGERDAYMESYYGCVADRDKGWRERDAARRAAAAWKRAAKFWFANLFHDNRAIKTRVRRALRGVHANKP